MSSSHQQLSTGARGGFGFELSGSYLEYGASGPSAQPTTVQRTTSRRDRQPRRCLDLAWEVAGVLEHDGGHGAIGTQLRRDPATPLVFSQLWRDPATALSLPQAASLTSSASHSKYAFSTRRHRGTHAQGEKAALSYLVPASLKQALQDLADADRRKLGPYVQLVLEDHVEAAKKKEGKKR